MRKTELRKGVREQQSEAYSRPIPGGSGMDEAAEDILFSDRPMLERLRNSSSCRETPEKNNPKCNNEEQ
jgi:hypothetical protein